MSRQQHETELLQRLETLQQQLYLQDRIEQQLQLQQPKQQTSQFLTWKQETGISLEQQSTPYAKAVLYGQREELYSSESLGGASSMCLAAASAVTLVVLLMLIVSNTWDVASMACFIGLVLCAGLGFGGLWHVGLLQPYWQFVLVGIYMLIAVVWLIGILMLQAGKQAENQPIALDAMNTYGEQGAGEVWKYQEPKAPAMQSFVPVPRKKVKGLCC